MAYNGDTSGNALYTSLTAGVSLPTVNLSDAAFTIPGGTASELYNELTRIQPGEITSGAVGGTGVFDVIMSGISAHLKVEYEKGRITGAEYTKAYIALTESALGNAVQFLMNREQAYWAGIQAQIAAISAKVQHETVKMQNALTEIQALSEAATFALTKMKLATEDVNYGQATYNLSSILPVELSKLTSEKALIDVQKSQGDFTLNHMMPKQLILVTEQTETHRAQTLNHRIDGQAVTGSIGKQKELHQQQITAYQRDIEIKAAKLFTDAWITMKTIDEGLPIPTQFQNDPIDTILQSIKTNVPIGW